ncbi:hypothetical protein GCM10020295_30710 [Streptomyces cinereospinus]
MSDPDTTAFLAATRTSYDTIAADYASRFPKALDGVPFDRAVVGAFAELARAHSPPRSPTWGPGPGTAPRSCTTWAFRCSAWTWRPGWWSWPGGRTRRSVSTWAR